MLVSILPFWLLSFWAIGQEKVAVPCDTIYLSNGQNVVAHVLEIKSDVVKYKKCNHPKGIVFIEYVADIEKIRFANGTIINTTGLDTRFTDPPKTTVDTTIFGRVFPALSNMIHPSRSVDPRISKKEKRKVVKKFLAYSPDSLKRNFYYINCSQLAFNSEMNLGYELRLTNRVRLNFNLGYKLENALCFVLFGFNEPIFGAYMGPRSSVSLKFYAKKGWCFGPLIRVSYLTISKQDFSSSSSSYAAAIYGLSSERKDLDAGFIFGKSLLTQNRLFQLFAVIGIRNNWATSTYQYKRSGYGGDNISISNGYMSYGLFQVGINYCFVKKNKA